MTATAFVTGYNGKVRSRDELFQWSQWAMLDPETQRRVLAILDASWDAGSPLGIGEIFRLFKTQESGFISRHHEVSATEKHCCTYNGKFYMLNPRTAHMAPPYKSYHEATTRAGKALAIDFTGGLSFLTANAAKFGLVEFSKINKEPWHAQPVGIPNSRSRYVLATMDPLAAFALPSGPAPAPAPIKVWAPSHTMKVGATTASVEDVKSFQLKCNFFGWLDMMGRTLIVDGDYGQKSAQGCIEMQRALGLLADGIYGPKSQAGLQAFLDAMSAMAK